MRTLPVIAVLALLGTGTAQARDRQLGMAVQTNVAVQTIDLTPSHAGIVAPGGSGTMVAESMKRYNTDRVKQPPTLRGTSQLGQQVSTAQGGGQQ